MLSHKKQMETSRLTKLLMSKWLSQLTGKSFLCNGRILPPLYPFYGAVNYLKKFCSLKNRLGNPKRRLSLSRMSLSNLAGVEFANHFVTQRPVNLSATPQCSNVWLPSESIRLRQVERTQATVLCERLFDRIRHISFLGPLALMDISANACIRHLTVCCEAIWWCWGYSQPACCLVLIEISQVGGRGQRGCLGRALFMHCDALGLRLTGFAPWNTAPHLRWWFLINNDFHLETWVHRQVVVWSWLRLFDR